MEEISNRETFLQRNVSKQPLSQSYSRMNFLCEKVPKSVIKENIPFNPEFQVKQSVDYKLIQIKLSSELATTSSAESGSHIFKHENYSFKVLSQKYRDVALELVSRQFADQQPLSKAFCSLFQQQKPHMFNLWKKAWGLHIDLSINDRLGVVVIDELDNKLIGISMAVKMNSLPSDLQQKLLKDFTVFPFNVAFQTQLINLVDKKNKFKLQQKQQVMDIMAVALDKQHMGKKLLQKMLAANQILAKKEGCKYSYVFASNFKTVIALQRLKYQLISQYPSRQFEYKGIKPYVLIQDLNKNPSLWLKSFDQ